MNYQSKQCMFFALPIICILSACTGANTALEPKNVRDTVAADLREAYKVDAADDGILTLELAIARAIKYNLDTKVAETEAFVSARDVTLTGLKALPTASLSVNRVGRSNLGGSSSRSLLTGIQSLEPSISTDQYRNTEQLNASWNALEAGLAISQARSATDRERVALERKRRVFEDVVSSTYSAYWRAAVAQRSAPMILGLKTGVDDQIKRLDAAAKAGVMPLGDAKTLKATLLAKRAALDGLQERIHMSELGLATLIGLPPGAPLRLDLSDEKWLAADKLPTISRDEETLRAVALVNRPEMRQELLNKTISARNVTAEIFATFPGAEAVLTGNRDSNSFLANSSWFDWTLGLTQSITKVLTFPARYRRAKADQKLTETRRHALVAAVVTQVAIARTRYDFMRQMFNATADVDENNRVLARRADGYAKAGMMGGPQRMVAEVDAAISSMDRMNSYAGAQEAYAQLLFTLGLDLWSGNKDGIELPEIARNVRANLIALEDQLLKADVKATAGRAANDNVEGKEAQSRS